MYTNIEYDIIIYTNQRNTYRINLWYIFVLECTFVRKDMAKGKERRRRKSRLHPSFACVVGKNSSRRSFRKERVFIASCLSRKVCQKYIEIMVYQIKSSCFSVFRLAIYSGSFKKQNWTNILIAHGLYNLYDCTKYCSTFIFDRDFICPDKYFDKKQKVKFGPLPMQYCSGVT